MEELLQRRGILKVTRVLVLVLALARSCAVRASHFLPGSDLVSRSHPRRAVADVGVDGRRAGRGAGRQGSDADEAARGRGGGAQGAGRAERRELERGAEKRLGRRVTEEEGTGVSRLV